MKFGKEFIRVIEQTQPEFRDKFLCYKQLKKALKQLPDTSAAPEGPPDSTGASTAAEHSKRELTPAERDFVRSLNAELSKFNEFFMEKEEELVMMDKALADRADKALREAATPPPALTALCHALAKFHGELVLLEHWCSLNYAALVKILKKHDKRSSLSLRLPILVNVLRQPFYSTEILSQLVRGTESRFHRLAARLKEAAAAGESAGEGAAGPSGRADAAALPPLMQLPTPPDESAAPEEEASMLARTRAALSCWEELKKSQSLGQPQQGFGGGAAGGGEPEDDDSSQDLPGGAPPQADQSAAAAGEEGDSAANKRQKHTR